MAQAEVIREFLVSLGFKTDEKSLKSFNNGIENATKNVVKLVGAISGAALTVGAGVSAFASNLEALYFASQKVGSSATNIKAFEKAAQNLGATAGDAMASIDSLARKMRENPGTESYIASLGVQTRDANGQLRESVDIMADLGRELAKKPYYLARQQADQLGIGEDTLRAIMNGDFARELSNQRDRVKNAGFDQAAKDAHKFMMGLRELQTYIEAFGLKVQDAIANKLGMSMEQFTDWFRDKAPMIASKVADLLVAIVSAAEKIGSMFIWLDEKTGGWSTKLLALLAVMRLIGGFAIISGILSLAGAFVKLGTAIAGASAAAGGAGAAGAAGGAAGGAASLWSKLMPWLGRLGGAASLMLFSGGLNEGEDEELRKRWAGQPQATGPGTSADKLRAIEQKYGLPAGLLDSVWAAESSRGQKMTSPKGAQGHFQFMPDTAKQYGLTDPNNFDQSADAAGRYYRDLMNRYGGNLYNAVAAYNWGPGNLEKKGMGNAPYETRKYINNVIGGMQGGGAAGGVTINQDTHISVQGSSDTQATANAVAGAQGRVNQNMTRNLQPLVR